MSAIFESKTLGPTERLIMLALADHADDDGRCYPSILRLCARTGLSERAVQTNVKTLTEKGYLKVLVGGGKGNANLYFVSPNPAANAPYEAQNPAASAPRRKCTPAADAPKTPHLLRSNPAADAPEPSGTTIEPSIEAAPRRRRKPELPIPEGWVPNEKNLEDARKLNLTEQEIRHEASQFRDRHLAKGSLFRDWDAAWRTWLGNIGKFSGRSMAGKAAPGGRGPGRSLASIVAERRIADADGRGFADQGQRDW